MLDIQSLSKTYGKICGVKDIIFTLSKGEIVGFIGPNGAGKSTTMNMISGCLAPTSGTAEADGVFLHSDPVGFKSKIGYLPEKPPLYTEFTVLEYLSTVAKFKRGEGKIGLNELINKFGLKDVKNRVIGNLSKGYKQRIGLAQAFVGNADYIILDEPTVGLDPAQKKQTLELIKSMKKDYGILLSSHILSEISFVCDRIIIISGGKIVKKLDNSFEEKNMYAYKITGDSARIIETLMSVDKVANVEKKGSTYIVEADRAALNDIFYRLAEEKLPIIGLSNYHVNVEDEFMKATDKGGKA